LRGPTLSQILADNQALAFAQDPIGYSYLNDLIVGWEAADAETEQAQEVG